MEPTIYKPSIYKGAGIYKAGSGGGGGGGGDGIYRVTIDGRVYPVTRITGDGYDKYWTCVNLYCTTGMTADTHYKKNSSYHNFVYYNKNSLSLIRALLPDGWDILSVTDGQKLTEIYGATRFPYMNLIEDGTNTTGLDLCFAGQYSNYYSSWRYAGTNGAIPLTNDYSKILSYDNAVCYVTDNGNRNDFFPLRVCKDV